MKFRDLFGKRSAAEKAAEEARLRRNHASFAKAPAAAGPAQRTPHRAHDLELSRQTQKWLVALPNTIAPTELCARYPRIANRLALCWEDATLTEQVFEDLLLDRRGGRSGFPSAVASELLRLRLFHAKHRKGDVRSPLWSSDSIAVSDR
jgi:hypothetical protein